MKRGATVLTIIACVAVFLAVLFFYLPASWFRGALPAQVTCRQVGGSLWHGECLGIGFQGATLGDATWNISPGRVFTGRLQGDFELRGSAVNLRSDLDLGFSGAGELRGVTGSVVLDPALVPQLHLQQRGTVSVNLERLELAAGPALRSLRGTLELRDLREMPQNMDIGSYQVTFDSPPQADGGLPGKLRDLGGPFAVEGTVMLHPPNHYLVQGFITGRTAFAESVVREITLGAMPDAAGRSALSFEGSF